MVDHEAKIALGILAILACGVTMMVGALLGFARTNTQWKTCPRCCGTGRIIHEDLIEVDGEYK